MFKRKNIFWIIIVVCAITFAAKFIKFKNNQIIDWQTKYPQLKTNNIGYSKLTASATNIAPKSNSQKALIGKVTNQFGIRDDVLKLILDTFPESDVRSTIAAIKMAQYYQQQIGVTDDKEINKLANKAGAAVSCQNLSMLDSYKFGQAYDKLIRDTPARKAEEDRIELLLNNHVISNDYGIQSYDIKEQCDHFLGVK